MQNTIFVSLSSDPKMEKLIYILVTFGYVLTFGILGAFTLMTKIPKEAGMKNYKKARTSLGCGLTILAIFSLTRLIFPQTYEHYLSFWLLVTFTLIHSWLTYSSLLFLMETPRYKIVQFLIDGIQHFPVCRQKDRACHRIVFRL